MLKDILNILNNPVGYLWRDEVNKLPAWRKKFNGALRHVYALVRDFFDGQLNLHAMGLVFTSLLALVPLIAVSFSVLKAFGVHNQLEPLLLQFLEPLGEKGIEITGTIISFVENVKAGVLGSIGLLLLFYTVISLIQKVERTFNYIWQVDSGRPLIRRISDYLSVTVIGPVFVFSAIAVTASVIGHGFVKDILTIGPAAMLFDFVVRLLPYLLIISIFTFVYIFMPNTKVKFKAALAGGVVAGVIWQTCSWVFAKFVVSATSYAAIYSGFAIVIVFMLWVYVNWLVLLTGSSVAFYTQYPENMLVKRDAVMATIAEKERLALAIIFDIASRYYNGDAPVTISQLVRSFGIPLRLAQQMLDNLEAAGLLVKTTGSVYMPAMPLDKLLVLDVLDAVRNTEVHRGKIKNQQFPVAEVDLFLNKIHQSAITSVGQLTVAEWVQQNPSHS